MFELIVFASPDPIRLDCVDVDDAIRTIAKVLRTFPDADVCISREGFGFAKVFGPEEFLPRWFRLTYFVATNQGARKVYPTLAARLAR